MRSTITRNLLLGGFVLAASAFVTDSADAQVGYYYAAPSYYVAPPVATYYAPAPVYMASPPVVTPVVYTPAYYYQPAPVVVTYYRARVRPHRSVYKYYTQYGIYRYRYRY